MTDELNRTRPYQLSTRQVYLDAAKARLEFILRSAEEFEAEVQIQASRHLVIFSEAMEGWHRSKAEWVKSSQESIGPDPEGQRPNPSAPRDRLAKDGAQPGTRRKLRVEKHARDGDPRFLAVANAALEARSKLLGLHLTRPEHGPSGDEPDGRNPGAAPGTPPRAFTIRLEMTEAARDLEDPEDRVAERLPVPAPNLTQVTASPSSAGSITMRPSSFAS